MRLSKTRNGVERHATMRDIIEKVPIPTAGVALALTALGNLLQPAYEGIHILCGAVALFLLWLMCVRIPTVGDVPVIPTTEAATEED